MTLDGGVSEDRRRGETVAARASERESNWSRSLREAKRVASARRISRAEDAGEQDGGEESPT